MKTRTLAACSTALGVLIVAGATHAQAVTAPDDPSPLPPAAAGCWIDVVIEYNTSDVIPAETPEAALKRREDDIKKLKDKAKDKKDLDIQVAMEDGVKKAKKMKKEEAAALGIAEAVTVEAFISLNDAGEVLGTTTVTATPKGGWLVTEQGTVLPGGGDCSQNLLF